MNDQPQLLLDSLLDQQKQAWLDGSRPEVDDLLEESSLQKNATFCST